MMKSIGQLSILIKVTSYPLLIKTATVSVATVGMYPLL